MAAKRIQMLLAGEALTFEVEHYHKDGHIFPLEVSASLISSGGESYIQCFHRDISERKQAEKERLQLEQQFQHAQKLESLGVLAGGIAHDFNNILQVIIGHCSLAKLKPRPGTVDTHIPEIEKAAGRAADLCRQMLAYAGKATSVSTQINMKSLVDEMVKMLKATFAKNVAIASELVTGLPTIKADASQLRQVVMNLIINAAEAIGEEQGKIGVVLTKCELLAGQLPVDHLGKSIPPGWYLRLEVSDTGCGMAGETKRRLFEPFYTTKFTGRGLGLSATLGIITAHAGALQLTSQPGHGTTFTVYLPIQNSTISDQEDPLQITPPPWQGSGTILLAEDEIQVKLIAKILLEQLGFTVLEASNGTEALALYLTHGADIRVVMTDMGMPVMDGYALFRELKKVNPELPIIISSGFGDTAIAARIARKDIAGLVSKPYSLEVLRNVLQSVLEAHH
jgi:signal transduction histidine kinase/CheY-like chemotaxis protein